MLIYGQVGGLGMPALKVHSIGQSAVRSKNFILRAVFSSYHPPSNRRQADQAEKQTQRVFGFPHRRRALSEAYAQPAVHSLDQAPARLPLRRRMPSQGWALVRADIS